MNSGSRSTITRLSLKIALGVFLSTGAIAGEVQYVSIPTPFKAAIQARHGDNCVAFIRADMKIRLPDVDLTTWQAKQAIVNVRTNPRYGDVAIIAVPTGGAAPYGHLAMVTDVTASSITIVEGNFKSGQVTERRATGKSIADAQSQLRIYGFYRP